jgi:hypothetical protein
LRCSFQVFEIAVGGVGHGYVTVLPVTACRWSPNTSAASRPCRSAISRCNLATSSAMVSAILNLTVSERRKVIFEAASLGLLTLG